MVIETRVIGKGTFTDSDREKLNVLFDKYTEEIGTGSPNNFSKAFWADIQRGTSLAIMAIDKSRDRSLGFVKLSIDRGKKPDLGIIHYYTVPEARKLGVATKLGKKAFMLARMMGADKMESSHPITPAGRATVAKIDSRQLEWKKTRRMPDFDEFMSTLRIRKRPCR